MASGSLPSSSFSMDSSKGILLNVAGQQVQDTIEYNRHCELYDCLQ